MDKRIAMKRAGQIALLWIAICLLALPVLAASTTLTIQVPDDMTVDLSIDGKGTVLVQGTAYESSTVLSVPRNEVLVLSVLPDEGWQLKRALVNGKDRTQDLYGDSVTITESAEGLSITILFARTNCPPQTGDLTILLCTGTMLLSAVAVAWLHKKQWYYKKLTAR